MLFKLAMLRRGKIEDVRQKNARLEGEIWMGYLDHLRAGNDNFLFRLPDTTELIVSLGTPHFLSEMFEEDIELPGRFLTVSVNDGTLLPVPIVVGGMFYASAEENADFTVSAILYALSRSENWIGKTKETREMSEAQEKIVRLRPACICAPSFRPSNENMYDESEENLIFTAAEMAGCLASALFLEHAPRENGRSLLQHT